MMLLPFLTIFLIAASLLSYELCLMRLLSILWWGHYAYMVVSLAMLGLGFSGVILALLAKFFYRRREYIILAGCFLVSLTLPLIFFLNKKLPLNYLYLIWDWRQWVYLGISYVLYGIPFLILATLLAAFFLQFPTKTNQVYAVNLLGSAGGVLWAVLLMYGVAPEKYLSAIGLGTALAGFLWGAHFPSRITKYISLVLLGICALVHLVFAPSTLLNHLSPYKGLAGLLRLPGTKILFNAYSPLGLIHLLEGPSIRLMPGLSLNSKEFLAPQKAITIDADNPSAILSDSRDVSRWTFLDETIYAGAYHLTESPKVFIVGANGDMDILLAQYHNSRSITVAELNPQVIDVIKNLSQEAGSRFVAEEARGFLEQTKERFDLIQLNPTGTLASSSSGIYAHTEDYLNTLEAYQTFIRRLTPEGIFMVSAWLKMPARDGIKIFYTAFEGLRKIGIEDPQRHLALIHNWDIITLLVARNPFTPQELETLRAFCQKRQFDISFLPDVKEQEVNRFHQLPQESYYEAARSIAEPSLKEEFAARYLFNIKPATDDKPYFGHFFRWKALPHLIKTLGTQWLPFMEHGYLVLFATFIQILLLGGVFILLPTAILLRKGNERPFWSPSWGLYFMVLGFSYMVLEMALIQKFLRFVHHPLYASAVVIATFLLFSGIGSILSTPWLRKRSYRLIPFISIAVIGAMYAFGLDAVFLQWGWAPLHLRLGITVLILAPLAFFMGMPFPFGMQQIVPTGEKNVGMAWGYNGFFSVVGAVATPLAAQWAGFKMITLVGCVGYILAMMLWARNEAPSSHQI